MEAHTPPTSTGTSDLSKIDKDCASSIKELGWWQGSIIRDADLRAISSGLPAGCDYWVLATQTCNLYNENFDSIHSVEWIGARTITKLGLPRSGADPRRFHCRALTISHASVAEELLLDCDIQARHWTNRRLLAELKPLSTALRDGSRADERHKDDFIGWVARSYTRLELSDVLNVALGKSKIADIIKKVLNDHHPRIYGVYLEISDSEDRATAFVEPPCEVELFFVVYDSSDEGPVKETLHDVLKQKVENPKYFPGPNVSRMIERRHVPEKFNIDFESMVKPMAQWSAVEINKCVRYSFFDHLSDSGLSA